MRKDTVNVWALKRGKTSHEMPGFLEASVLYSWLVNFFGGFTFLKSKSRLYMLHVLHKNLHCIRLISFSPVAFEPELREYLR